ncbi:PD-(D/E)XK nuclease family protein [Corynebacterium striatum]|uniref:PD-(D/E)XK nuclease family protein n=1 Tax=Corynebacterium striatum TaxID=43770 RepID=UPI003B63FBDC
MSYDPRSTARAGVVLPPSPQVRLVPRTSQRSSRSWDFPLPETGRWRVTGTAGSGVSSLLVDVVLNKLSSGADPSGILVVSTSKESGSILRRELAQHLEDYAAQASMVRSVHSLAFALLRTISEEEIRLITGAEQDAVIRELLEGQAEENRGSWPAEVRPAMTFVGFARQLRDLLLRAIERGKGPHELMELGKKYQKPMWTAAGEFLLEYERTQQLAGLHSYSAAELVNEVLLHSELVEKHPWHTIIVDDAQLLDPTSGKLIEGLSRSTELTVVAGDPDQAVFAFRGANSEFLTSFPAEHELVLEEPRRRPAPACISIVDSRSTLRDVVADAVRRRHLEDEVPWREIAVIVRSTGDIGQVRRTLLAAGVPVHINPTDVILAEQRLVKSILLALRALDHELSNTELEELVTGPVGGADPVTLRRLIRGLRRWAPQSRGIDSLRALLEGELPDFSGLLTEREQTILERIRSILDAGRAALRAQVSIEETLWEVWNATGLDARLQAAALRGGATGSQADRDLDAMMSLFDAAGDYSERRPGASLEAFLRHIEEQELPTGVRDRRTTIPQAVEVITAHGAVGREWDTVVIAGAQEGTWPSLGETGSVFGQEGLIDLLDKGIAPGTPVSHVASRLREERRLFHVATTRHRRRLLIAAVDAPEAAVPEEPSRFVGEFALSGSVDVPGAQTRREATKRLRAAQLPRELGLAVPEPAPVSVRAEREIDPLDVAVLSVPSFVAQLRRVVVSASSGEAERSQAARQLARLAKAGVPGAHPESWWAARSVATDVLADMEEAVAVGRVSPSRVEALLNCPLSAILGNLAEEESTPMHLIRGTMAHAYLEALGRGIEPELGKKMVMEAFASIVDGPGWKMRSDMAAFERLIDRTHQWAMNSESSFELIGVEVPVSVEVLPGITVAGYMDRLVKAGDDYMVVDLKTGNSAVTAKQAKENPQLMTYQLALERGELVGVVDADDAEAGENPGSSPVIRTGEGLPRGGGVLVYPAHDSVKITTRDQAAVPPEELAAFAEKLPALVAELHSERLTARENDSCDRCAIRSICPVQAEGKQVSDEFAV